MKHGRAIVVGLGLTVALTAALPLSLVAARPGPELSATVSSPGPYEVRASADEPLVTVTARPTDLIARLAQRGAFIDRAPGLSFRTWEVTYAQRWDRQLTLPVLTGPFEPEGAEWTCDMRAFVPADVFVQPDIRAAVERLLERSIRRAFPRTVQGIWFPQLARIALDDLRLVESGLSVRARIILVDRTVITVSADLTASIRGGQLSFRRVAPTRVAWTGPTRSGVGDSICGPLNVFNACEWLFGARADGRARNIVTAELDQALSTLRLPGESGSLSGRAGDAISLTLAADTRVTPRGVFLRACPHVRLAPPRISSTVPGPLRSMSESAWGPVEPGADGAPRIVASLSSVGLNQVLYVLWQTGALRRTGQSREILDLLPPATRDLVFAITGFDPMLPPVVRPAATGGFGVTVGDVALGRLDEGTVVAHAAASLTARAAAGGEVAVDAAVTDVRANCVREHPPGHWTLTPCLGDAISALRTRLDRPVQVRLDQEHLARWMHVTIEGIDVASSDVRVDTTAAPSQLVVSAAIHAR